jgi:chromosome partitioning protein
MDLMDVLGGITVHGVYKALKSHNIDVIETESRRKKVTPLGVRKLLIERGFQYPRENISFQVVKGGVGKTSLSYALGLRASHYGARVLLVDFDQQGNLTRSFKIEARDFPVWLNIFRDNVPVEKSIVKLTETLDLIPSNLNNSRLDLELTQATTNLRDMIRDALSPIRDNYDLVIFDCPPAINKINLAASCASDTVIIPVNPDPYAMDGLDFTLSELKRIKQDFKLGFDYKIVWNRYDARERLGALCMHDLAKDANKIKNVLPVVIRVDVSLKNSIFDAVSLFDLPKKSAIREDVDQFAKEILGINNWIELQKNDALQPATAIA